MSSEADHALLRCFEPIIRYTRGEQFFPMDVRPYVQASSLWTQTPDQEAVCLIPEGELTLEKMGETHPSEFDATTYLKFIEPLNIAELATYTIQEGLKKKDPRDVFRAGRGRLARVGYFSRFVDALFSLTLLARGRVPGDTAAAAALAYRKIMAEQEHYCYYGRVVRLPSWIALQYWFFYPFNNWRSGFNGVNDHEADWEMVYVYLSESAQGEITPQWAAYASHDFSGDDLRRRWDDPELEKVGEHPVIYAGAGSHASYYARGEYLAELELPFLSPIVRLTDKIQNYWLKITQRGNLRAAQQSAFNIFRVPFVDYARGDGIVIGPGGDKAWAESRLLDPLPDWAIRYRGLWGLYARDPIAGENAPAGPIYNRNGSVRRSWHDPLGWAGLDKVLPPSETLALTEKRCREIEARQDEIAASIAQKSEQMVNLGIEAEAMQPHPHLKSQHAAHQKQIGALSEEIKRLRIQRASDAALLEALKFQAARLRRGEQGPARAHIHRAHHPTSDTGIRLSRFAETWSAISIGVMMLGFVAIVLFARNYLLLGLIAMVSIIVLVEAGFRQRLTRLISSLTIALAVVSVLVLLFEFFWSIVVIGVLIAGGYIVWENIKELRA